jgi:predicted PurR-regulated permease PerM
MSEHERNEDLLPDDPSPRPRDEDFDHHDPLEAEPPPPSAEPVVVPRWIQLVSLPLLLLLVYAIVKAAGIVVLLFVTAAVIALILNPLVAGLQRARLPRGLAIVCVYLGFIGALAAAGVLLANPISDQVTTLRDDIPSITRSANERLADVQDYFDRKGINVEIKRQGQTALETLQEKVVGGTDSIVSFGTDLLTKIVTAGFGLILVFVLSVYMLIHGERIGALVRGVMPPGDGTREDD